MPPENRLGKFVLHGIYSIEYWPTDPVLHAYIQLSFIPLNLGDSYGILKIMDNGEIPAFNDIVVFRSLPNDLSHVRGIITDVSQTPLSHVNLKAKQNNLRNVSHLQRPATCWADTPIYFRNKSECFPVRSKITRSDSII